MMNTMLVVPFEYKSRLIMLNRNTIQYMLMALIDIHAAHDSVLFENAHLKF